MSISPFVNSKSPSPTSSFISTLSKSIKSSAPLAIPAFFSKSFSNCECFIWLGSCYGGCDVPIETERLGMDLIVQFGHSAWNFKNNEIRVIG